MIVPLPSAKARGGKTVMVVRRGFDELCPANRAGEDLATGKGLRTEAARSWRRRRAPLHLALFRALVHAEEKGDGCCLQRLVKRLQDLLKTMARQ